MVVVATHLSQADHLSERRSVRDVEDETGDVTTPVVQQETRVFPLDFTELGRHEAAP